jgi:hypothetical protein
MKTVTCAFCASSVVVDKLNSHVCTGIDLLSKSNSGSSSAAATTSKAATKQGSPEMRKMTSSLEELFDPIAFASAPDIDEDDNTNRNNARSNEKQKAVNSKSSSSSASRVLVIDDDAECPVCGREFAMDKIEMHVVSCLDEASEGNVAPPPVRAGRVAAEVDESGLINVELPHEDVVNDQTRHFQLWVERRKQEEADRLLAERMSRDAGAALPASPRRAPARVAIAIVDEERASEQLARRLAADDVAVQLDAESEALAKRLHEQEQAQIDAQRRCRRGVGALGGRVRAS